MDYGRSFGLYEHSYYMTEKFVPLLKFLQAARGRKLTFSFYTEIMLYF